MNLIDFLKIKQILSVSKAEYKINLDGSIDFLGEFTQIDIKDIIKMFPKIDISNFELPFKINSSYNFILLNHCKEWVQFKSCKNFPKYCCGDMIIENGNITIKSLEEIGIIKDSLSLSLKYGFYYNKESVLNNYPNLKIGKYFRNSYGKEIEFNDDVEEYFESYRDYQN